MPHTTSHDQPAGSRRRWLGIAALGGIGLAAAGAGAQAVAQRGGGFGRDPEEMLRRLDYRVGYLIKEVGGTPEQKDRLVAIAKSAYADLQPMRAQRRQLRQRGIDVLGSSSIDRNALELIRREQMQLADARSRRTVQAWADAADVLTPGQRQIVAQRHAKRLERLRG